MTKRLIWKTEKNGERSAYNSTDEKRVGCIKLGRVGAHMHWLWYQEQGVHMSPGCLDEVRDKQKELFKFRKKMLGDLR